MERILKTIVEISRTSVRALQVTAAGMSTCVTEPVSGELTVEQVRAVLARLPGAPAQTVVAVPREQVITRSLTFPTVNPDELANMAGLAAHANLPYPPDQVVSDVYVVEQRKGTSAVQLVACRREWIERHVAVLRQAGCEPSLIAPSSWGLAAWLVHAGRVSTSHPVLLISLDTDRTDLVAVWKNRLVFSRSLGQGAAEWQDASDRFQAFERELERTLLSLGKELPDLEVSSFVLAGADAPDAWDGRLESRFGKPVSVIRPDAPAVLLGLASAEPDQLVNLVPPAVRQAQQSRRSMRDLLLTGQLLGAAVVLGVGLLTTAVTRQHRIVARATQELNQLESVTTHSAAREHSLRMVERVFTLRGRMATALADVLRVTPPNVLFESLSCEQGRGELIVRGSAPSTSDVLAYLRQLEQSGVWSRVELRYSARRGAVAGSRTDFEILLRMEG